MNPQPIAARGKWQIDQFKLELLPGLVIYERNGVARIQFGHYSLLTQRSAFAKLRRTGAIYHVRLRQSKTKIVAA